MKLKLKRSYVAIVFLIFIVIGLSFAIGIKYFSLSQAQKSKIITVLPVTPTPDPAIEALLDTPPQDASEDVKQKHFAKVLKYAKDADYLDITVCSGKPVVLFVNNQRPVIIKNGDASSHEISINKDARYTIPAKSSESYLLSFKEGPGVYGYGCDQLGRTAGFFVVRP